MMQAVFFDLDGTLVDTAPDLAFALNMQREYHGLLPLPLETIRPYASHGTSGLLSIGFGLVPEDDRFPSMRDEYLALYDTVFTRSPMLFEGLEAVLAALEESAIPWGVVTNKPRRFTLPLMASLHLTERAIAIVSGDDAARPKPYPDSLFLACETAGVDPAQCIYVGDAERDVKAATAAGMPSVVACYGYIEAHESPRQWGAQSCIDHPEDLMQLLV